MAITNSVSIKFVNEVIRPLSEDIRALKLRIDDAIISWFVSHSAVITNDSSAIADGRDADGVSRLTGADVNNVMTQLLAIQTLLNQSGVSDVIAKPCVRVIEIN